MKKKGFTLIELLVVITIIAIIASMVITVAAQMQEKARVENTKATILVLHTACETYKGDFFLYPDIHNFPRSKGTTTNPILIYDGEDGQPNPTTVSSPPTDPPAGAVLCVNNGAFDAEVTPANGSRRLRYLLSTPFEIDEVVKEAYLQQQGMASIDPNDTPDKESDDLFVDAWGNFLRILPGRDHSQSPANNPIGPNFFNNTTRARTPLDIYSVGPDGADNTNGDYETTSFDLEATDDVVNWFAERAK